MLERRVQRSVTSLTRVAAVVALVGLSVFAVSMFYPRPLVVILSMSVGHVIGAAALLLYLLAVVLDTLRSNKPSHAAGQADGVDIRHSDTDASDTDVSDVDESARRG